MAKKAIRNTNENKVDPLLNEHRFAEAVNIAKKQLTASASTLNLTLYHKSVCMASEFCWYTLHNHALHLLQKHLKEIPQFHTPDGSTLSAELLARTGDLPEALQRLGAEPDPQLLAKVLAHSADYSIYKQSPRTMPAEFHAQYRDIVLAFEQFQTGKDDEARVTLGRIGLQSPYLEWKLFLRGLIALHTDDLVRAHENFSRLTAHRLPYVLSLPFRQRCWPQEVRPSFEREYSEHANRVLQTNPLIQQICRLVDYAATNTNDDKELWKIVQRVIVDLKNMPDQFARFRILLYKHIQKYCGPDSREPFLKTVGPVEFDPNLDLLSAIGYESAHELELSLNHWQAYLDWLMANSLPVPNAVRARMQAIVCHKLFEIQVQINNKAHRSSRSKSKTSKPKSPEPCQYLERAIQADPSWDVPISILAHEYQQMGNVTRAFELLKRSAKTHSESETILTELMYLAAEVGEIETEYEAAHLLLAIKSFDRRTQELAAMTTFQLFIDLFGLGQYSEIVDLMEKHNELFSRHARIPFLNLIELISPFIKDKNRLSALASQSTLDPMLLPAKAFHQQLMTHAVKVKPATKKVIKADFLKQLALIDSIDTYLSCLKLIEYSHESPHAPSTTVKSLLKMLPLFITLRESEEQLEDLCMTLREIGLIESLKRVIRKLCSKFIDNPCFALIDAELMLSKKKPGLFHSPAFRLIHALQLAKASTLPRHKKCVEIIETLLNDIRDKLAVSPLMDIFNLMNRRK